MAAKRGTTSKKRPAKKERDKDRDESREESKGRSFWKGHLSFGLVEIGVTLQPARADHDLSFTLLDSADYSPVGYRRYNKRTGAEVPWDRIVRGYEYEDEQYVVLTDEELRQAYVKANQTIEVISFVERSAIDPVYFDTPYFVLPQKRSSRSYRLLRDTLESTGLVGIVRMVLRTRQHLGALLVHDGGIVLETLRFANEIKPSVRLESGTNGSSKGDAGAKPTAAELRMATMLVEDMKTEWNPESFHDEYRDDVMALIEKKVKSGRIHEIVAEKKEKESRAPAAVVDLVEMLKKSIAERGSRPALRARSTDASRTARRRRA
jgi:DNA end-binding protein Ku